MITDKQLADLCVGSYAYPGYPVIAWDESDDSFPGISYRIKRIDDVDVVVFEGSHDVIGWRKNFDAWAQAETYRGQTLELHPGFWSLLPDVWRQRIQKQVRSRVIITGHSRGAAQAVDLACIAIDDGLIPEALIGFGEPKSGYKSQADHLAVIPRQRVYRNGDATHHDQITDVAYTLPLMPYQHRVPLTVVTAPPPENDAWGMFAWHHCWLYAEALAKDL